MFVLVKMVVSFKSLMGLIYKCFPRMSGTSWLIGHRTILPNRACQGIWCMLHFQAAEEHCLKTKMNCISELNRNMLMNFIIV